MKHIQALSLLDHHFHSFDLSYPARSIDPESRFSPFDPAFCASTKQGIQGQYSAYYIFFLAVFLKLFGHWGSTLFLFCGGCFLMWSLHRLSQSPALGPSPDSTTFYGGLLGTPILFYLFNLYETVWLCAFTALFLERYFSRDSKPVSLFMAGALLSALPALRFEGYAYALFLGLACFFSRETPQKKSGLFLGLGFALPLIPLWLFHQTHFGHIFGPMLETDHQSPHTLGVPAWSLCLQRLDLVLFQLQNIPALKTVWEWVYVLGALFFIACRKWAFCRKPFFYAVVCGILILDLHFLSSGSMNRSFVLLAPVLALLLLSPHLQGGPDRTLMIAVSAVFFSVTFFVSVENPSDFGSRYLVPLLLPCLVLILRTVSFQKNIFFMLVFLGVACEFQALQEFQKRTNIYSKRSEWLLKRPESIVLTDSPHSVQVFAKLYLDKKWMYLFSMQDPKAPMETYGERFETGLDALDRQGIHEFIFITEKSSFCEDDVQIGSKLEMEMPSGKTARFEVLQKEPDRGRSVMAALRWSYSP